MTISRMEFMSKALLSSMSQDEKIKYIVNRIKNYKALLVLDETLSPEDEIKLIEYTMKEVDFENFTGIKMLRFDLLEKKGGKRRGRKPKNRQITVVAPAGIVEISSKDEGFLAIDILN